MVFGFDFDEQQKLGDARAECIMRHLNRLDGWHVTAQERAHTLQSRIGMDCFADIDGMRQSLELKGCSLIESTGNVFVEMVSSTRPGAVAWEMDPWAEGDDIIKGWARTSTASWLVYGGFADKTTTTDLRSIHVLKLQVLRDVLPEWTVRPLRPVRYPTVRDGVFQYQSFGWPIPVEELEKRGCLVTKFVMTAYGLRCQPKQMDFLDRLY